MIKVSNEVTVYEVNGEETKGLERPTITVNSHWNRNELVVLVVDGKRLTFVAKDIETAIGNATRSARW